MAELAIPAPSAAAEAPPRPDFQIVPLRGLPIVAAVLIALIAAIAANKIWALEFFHVAAGALWTGIDLFLGLVLGPILGRLTIPARVENDDPADAEGAAHHADARHRDAGVRLAARALPGNDQQRLRQSRLDRRLLHRRRGHGRHRPRPARAGQRGGPLRAQEAAPESGGHRAAHEALHLHRRGHRGDAGCHARDHDQGRDRMTERRLPPVTGVAITSMALIVTGGIWIASHLPHHVPLGPAVALLAASALLVVVNVVSLARVPDFNWGSFFLVAKWAGLAYAITAAILEWVFVKDGTSGGQLVVVTLSLVVYAVHVPLLIGFTVARYDPLT